MKHLILAIAAICLASCTCATCKKDSASCPHCDKAAAAKPEDCKMCDKPKGTTNSKKQ